MNLLFFAHSSYDSVKLELKKKWQNKTIAHATYLWHQLCELDKEFIFRGPCPPQTTLTLSSKMGRVCIPLTPAPRAGCDIWLIFKLSTTGLNSSLLLRLVEDKPVYPTIHIYGVGEKDGLGYLRPLKRNADRAEIFWHHPLVNTRVFDLKMNLCQNLPI